MIDTHNVTPDTLNATAKEEINSEDTGKQGKIEETGKDRRDRQETGKKQGRNRER